MRTKRGKGNEWLLLKKKDAFAQPGWDPEEHARSVASGRTQEEIAQGLAAVPAKSKESRGLAKVAGARKAPMPDNVAPMLAQIGRGSPPGGAEWLYEIKWDGVRALCYIDGGQQKMVTRNGNLMDRQYPELSVLPHHVKAEQAILDAEIAVLDERGGS